MTLYINTADFRAVVFRLIEGKKMTAEYTAVLGMFDGHKIISHLQKFLAKNKISLQNLKGADSNLIIDKIYLYSGPGSFTGLRISQALAEALSLAWDVPITIINTNLAD